MPTIACLGWGSLIWHQGSLPIVGDWQPDGPSLALEFARQSTRGMNADALTLVVVPGYVPRVTSLWVRLSVETPEAAREALRVREGVGEPRREVWIGLWRNTDTAAPAIPEIPSWAQQHDVSAVVWTALPPRFSGQDGLAPSADEAVNYLRGLTGEPRETAERYVRKAHPQIDTPYRQRFVAEFGWTPV